MDNHWNKYVNEVAKGLLKTAVTEKNQAPITIDDALDIWADKAYSIRQNRGLVIFAGNGASASMAEHMSSDCIKSAGMRTLTFSETTYLTAIGNDLSFDDAFSFKLMRFANEGDMLVAISSSGNSPNVISAINAAREKDMYVVTISGKDKNNKARKLGDLNFYVPLPTYGLVESAHATLLHCWLDYFLDKYEGGRL